MIDEKGRFVKGYSSPYKGMSLEERYGKERAKEIKKKISDNLIGRHSNPANEFTSENTKGEKNPFYGHKHTEEAKQKNRLIHLGKRESKETRLKKGKKTKERWANPKYRLKMLPVLKEANIKYAEKRDKGVKFHNAAIKDEMKKLESQGFRCVNVGTTKVKKPDIIAIKNGKVYAVEVETLAQGNPDYNKWEGTTVFDDIIWVIRRMEDKNNV